MKKLYLVLSLNLVLLPIGCSSIGVGISYSDSDLIDGSVIIIKSESQFTESIDGYCEQVIIPTIIDTVVINHCGVMVNF